MNMTENYSPNHLNGCVPLAYHITFTCYGNRLHGDASGTTSRRYFNSPGGERIPYKPGLVLTEREMMIQPPYELDTTRRKIVLDAIIGTCARRGWSLYAAHVRSTHVHVLVYSILKPERVMNDLKAFASKRLNESGLDDKCRKRWARHGSTMYKWTDAEVEAAFHYILRQQGAPMEVFDITNTLE
jgi:REP element-mobilizing transposase RayT